MSDLPLRITPTPLPVAIRVALMGIALGSCYAVADSLPPEQAKSSRFLEFAAPAEDRPTTLQTTIDGYSAAILPNGRFVTPTGIEVPVDAPKPFGMALSPDGKTLATVNSGASRFSVTLITKLGSSQPDRKRVNLDATFMGIVFSPDSQRFYVAGGENGNVWIGETASGRIIGSVSLNGPTHPLNAGQPLDPSATPQNRFKGTFPGNMALGKNGRYLYVVDQGAFQVHVIDTTLIKTGTDAQGLVQEPNNFAAVAGRVKVGRYPFGIRVSNDGKTLFVSHVGVFQYTHLMPPHPVGDNDVDYPLCYPGAGYPDESVHDRTIKIKHVDPRKLPADLRDPEGIRCGYVQEDIDYRLPGVGSPNAAESSSVYALDLSNPASPKLKSVVKPGPHVGDREAGIETYGGSHPNAVAVGPKAVYVANGNNDTVSVLDRQTYKELGRISLSLLEGSDRRLKGVQPVALALSPDARYLYVAEAGVNALAVIKLEGKSGRLAGHIPTGWWPSSVAVSNDGKTLYVANARGRGAGANTIGESNSPKHSVMGSVSIFQVPTEEKLEAYTLRVYANNGFVEKELAEGNNPIPAKPGMASRQIKHIVFINKENATYDLVFGNILQTRGGQPVNGEPSLSLGYDAWPNHQELALRFAFSDNFYLEPSVSSDGHRWLTDQFTTENEETHWPASYGGRRRDAGDDNKEVADHYPGRLGFTDANSSPDPNDYNQHGGIYLHLARNGKDFVNFGNGFELALIDEPGNVEPTGAREHVNIPMEKVVRDNSDHLFPTYNTHIPDAPLSEDPTRYSRFGRFQQVFESHYVDRQGGKCKLPSYVDLYYPNDHGGGAFDINPAGPAWSFKRFAQDNDAALGKTVELISNSPCWKDTVIFVLEDDTQNGADHVDGHRSILLAISPWAKREYVSKTHTSLGSVFKTVELILGIPPLNQYDAAATDLRDMFTSVPNYAPYTFTTVDYARAPNPVWTAMTKDIDFQRPDAEEINLRDAIMKSEGLPRKAK